MYNRTLGLTLHILHISRSTVFEIIQECTFQRIPGVKMRPIKKSTSGVGPGVVIKYILKNHIYTHPQGEMKNQVSLGQTGSHFVCSIGTKRPDAVTFHLYIYVRTNGQKRW